MKRTSQIFMVVVLAALLAVLCWTFRLRAAGEPARETEPPASEAETQEWWADMPSTVPDSPPPATEAPETPPPTPTPEPEYYSLHFVGDCTLASLPGFPGGYAEVVGDDYAYPFAETLDYFRDDDFTFANLEVALTESDVYVNKTYRFKAPAEYAKILTEGSVEFATLANNHVLDYGQQGYDDTKAAVAAEGIAYAGRDEWAVYETARGLKIGVYAVSFGTVDQIRAGIAAVQDAGADFVIAALHWGDEGSYRANADQITQGRAAIDAGADFVYGSHPHTLQPVEEYNGHYIYYSMGNWTFGGNTNPRDKDTLILHMTLRVDPDGSVTVAELENIPCSCSGTDNSNNYQPVPLEPGSERYERVLSKLDGTFTGANLSIGYGYSANE